MINPFVFSKKEEVLVLDIRDGSVGGMILSLDKKGQEVPEKIFSIRKEIPFQRNFNHKRLFYNTSQALISVSAEIFKSGLKMPKKIFCLLGPHLHASQIRIIKSRYDRPTIISEKIISSLINQDVKLFENKHLGVLGESFSEMMEHKITQIKLNGYETGSPINKVASEIELSVFVSMVPHVLIGDLKRIILKHFHSDNVDFHSFSFALADVVRDISLDKRGFAIVNIEDEISEISVVRNGLIEDTASFPAGANFLFRMIMDRFGVSYEQALSYLKLFVAHSGDESITTKMSDIIEQTRIFWTDSFYQSLKKMSSHHLLPDTFYIATDDNQKNVFLDFIKKSRVSGLLVLNKPPAIEWLEPKIFSGLCKNISECPDDTHFLVSAVFVNKFHSHHSSYFVGEEKGFFKK